MATSSAPGVVLAFLYAAVFLFALTTAEEAREEAGVEDQPRVLVPYLQANTALLHRAAAITGLSPDSAALVAAASLDERPQTPDGEQLQPVHPDQHNDEPIKHQSQRGPQNAKLASHNHHPQVTGAVFPNRRPQELPSLEPVRIPKIPQVRHEEEPFQNQHIPVRSPSAGALPHRIIPVADQPQPHKTLPISPAPEVRSFQQPPHLAAIAVAPPPHFQRSSQGSARPPLHQAQHQHAETVQAELTPQHPVSAHPIPYLQPVAGRQTEAEAVPGRRAPYLPSPVAAAPKQPSHRVPPPAEEGPSRQPPYLPSPVAPVLTRHAHRVPQVVEEVPSHLPPRAAAHTKQHVHRDRPVAEAASFHNIHHIAPAAGALPLRHISHPSAFVGAAPLQQAQHSAPVAGAASHHKATHASSGGHGGGGHGGSGASGKSGGGSLGSGASSHHHKEKGAKGSSGSEKSHHSSGVEKGGGSSHSAGGGHAAHHHQQGGGAHGHKYKGGGHRAKNGFTKGYRDKYHKDEHHHLDDYWSHGQEKGHFHKFGEHGAHFSKKGKKKEASTKATKGGAEGQHGSSGKSGKGHATSDKSGHAGHGGRSSSHQHASQYAKKSSQSSHKKTAGDKQ